jgi:hypothetical protein
MKKLIFITVLMLTVVLMSTTSCSKKDNVVAPVTPEIVGKISSIDLQGTWNFQSFQMTETSAILSESSIVGMAYSKTNLTGKTNIHLSFQFGNTDCIVTDAYKVSNLLSQSGSYTLTNTKVSSDVKTVINISSSISSSSNFTYEVLSYTKATQTLVIKLTTSILSSDIINGIITLKK